MANSKEAPVYPCPRSCEIGAELRECERVIADAGTIDYLGKTLRVAKVGFSCPGESEPIQAHICHGVVKVVPVGLKPELIVL